MKYLYYILRLFLRPECNHKWEKKDTIKKSIEGRVTGVYYRLDCKHCGDIKLVELE